MVSVIVSCILLRTSYLCLRSMCRGFSLYTHIHVRKDSFPLPKIAQICTQISQVREVFPIPICHVNNIILARMLPACCATLPFRLVTL